MPSLVARGPHAVSHSLRGEGFDGSEDGTGRGTPIVTETVGALTDGAHNGGGLNGQDAYSGRIFPVAFSAKDYGADATSELCPTLRAGGHDKSHANSGNWPAIAIQDGVHTNKDQNGAGINADGSAYTLDTKGHQAVAFAQNSRDEVRKIGGDGDITGALSADKGSKQQSYIAEPITLALRGRGGEPSKETRQDGTANALLTPNGGRGGMGVGAVAIQELAVSENPDAGPDGKGFRDDGAAFTMESRTVPQAVAYHYAVRRLTPVECERLQGFPDNYTRISYRKKPAEKCPDGPRYKSLGNSWAVPVVAWIFDRLDQVDRIARGEPA